MQHYQHHIYPEVTSMKLFFLGTSAANPTKDRNLPAVALQLNNGDIILFDAGEDVQRRFEMTLKMNVPTYICISHLHGDHIIGLPGLLFNFHLGDRTAPVTLIGPQGLYEYILFHMAIIGLKLTFPVSLIEVVYSHKKSEEQADQENIEANSENSKKNLTKSLEIHKFLDITTAIQTPPDYESYSSLNGTIIETPAFKLRTAWVDHSIPTLGFRLEEAERDGKFNPDRARELNIPEGRLWGKMHKGMAIQLHDGRQIDPIKEGIVGPRRPGLILCYSGDTAPCDSLIALAQSSNYFICECTYADEEELLAVEKKHMCAKMVAEIALKSHVQMLFLTHYSTRYKDIEILEIQAKKKFPNTIAANDLAEFELKHSE